MEDNKKVVIQNSDGSTVEVELVTYLVNDDCSKAYIVYSKGEKNGAEEDEIIYISRVESAGDNKKLIDITDDNEWASVQKMLKKIANAAQ